MNRYNTLDWVGWALTTVGALNWGLKGLAHYNLVHDLFGRYPTVERTIYSLVGLAGVLSLVRFVEFSSTERPAERIGLTR